MFLFLFSFVIHADQDWEINEIMPDFSRYTVQIRKHAWPQPFTCGFWEHWMSPWVCMIGISCYVQLCHTQTRYHISRPIRRNFFLENCELNSTCILCAEGKYYFQTYKYLYFYYTTSFFTTALRTHLERGVDKQCLRDRKSLVRRTTLRRKSRTDLSFVLLSAHWTDRFC
jgi:hypothetical protein